MAPMKRPAAAPAATKAAPKGPPAKRAAPPPPATAPASGASKKATVRTSPPGATLAPGDGDGQANAAVVAELAILRERVRVENERAVRAEEMVEVRTKHAMEAEARVARAEGRAEVFEAEAVKSKELLERACRAEEQAAAIKDTNSNLPFLVRAVLGSVGEQRGIGGRSFVSQQSATPRARQLASLCMEPIKIEFEDTDKDNCIKSSSMPTPRSFASGAASRVAKGASGAAGDVPSPSRKAGAAGGKKQAGRSASGQRAATTASKKVASGSAMSDASGGSRGSGGGFVRALGAAFAR